MDDSKISTQELIDRCIARDERAWKEFLRRFDEHIARTCIKAIRSHGKQPTKSLVCDMKSETYLRLCCKDFQALRTFKCIHEKAIYGYLGTVARNAVHDQYRDRENLVETEELSPELPSREKMKNLILVKEMAEHLDKKISATPNGERDIAIFKLYYWQGYSAREIAELCSLKTKAVENILLRLIKILRDRINPGPNRP